MRFRSILLYLTSFLFIVNDVNGKKNSRLLGNEVCEVEGSLLTSNSCVQFSVGQGTGCAWMCNYCASQLGTNNYYFTDNVCKYQEGQGCVGNPIAGKLYTCCSA
jgi:hypothetical protein